MNTQTIYDTIETLDLIRKRAIYINNLICTHDTEGVVSNGMCIVDPKLISVGLNEFNVSLTYLETYWGKTQDWYVDNEYFDMCDEDIINSVKVKLQNHAETCSKVKVNMLQYEADLLGYELIKKGE